MLGVADDVRWRAGLLTRAIIEQGPGLVPVIHGTYLRAVEQGLTWVLVLPKNL
jgi:hypothetical protein